MDEFRTVSLFNPLPEPFELRYNKTIARTIPPGKSLRMPWLPLGFLGLKHLIDACCNYHKENTGDPAIRAKWEAKVLIKDDDNTLDKPMTPDEVLQRKLDLLNNTNASNMVVTCEKCSVKVFSLNEHNALNHEVTPTQPVPPVVPVRPDLQDMSSKILANAVSAKEAVELPEEKVEAPALPPVQPETKPEPTKEALIAYARDTLKVNVDDPDTKKFIDNASVEQLKKEFMWGL